MSQNLPLDTNSEQIRVFVSTVEDSCERLDRHLVSAISGSNVEYHLEELCRELQSIRNHAHSCQLWPMEQLAQAIEILLDRLHADHRLLTASVSRMLLEVVGQYREAAFDLEKSGDYQEDMIVALAEDLGSLAEIRAREIDQFARQIVGELSGNVERIEQTPVTGNHFTANTPANIIEDLEYFRELAERMEINIVFWQGRSARMGELAQSMNRLSGNRVVPHQLEAAIYMHDIACAFLPDDLIFRQVSYDQKEYAQIQAHPQMSAGMLRRMPGWQDAALMCLQHHERCDGKGYPAGLNADGICDGAKVIAIVDAFESMTGERPDRTSRTSVLRAVKEINLHSGTQFDTEWVHLFNEVIREKYVKT